MRSFPRACLSVFCELRSGLINYLRRRNPQGELIGAALSFVSFFVAVDKESDLPWVNHPLPRFLKISALESFPTISSISYIHVDQIVNNKKTLTPTMRLHLKPKRI